MITVHSFYVPVQMLFSSEPLTTNWTFGVFTSFHMDKFNMSLPISQMARLFSTQEASPGLTPQTSRI